MIRKQLPKRNKIEYVDANSSFYVNKNWTEVPDDINIENCHELVQGKDGRIFLSVDHPDNNILIFSQSGVFIDSWTLGYDGCHGLTIFEQNGSEYLLITQTGVQEIAGVVTKNLGEVVKTSLSGEVVHRFSNPIELGLYRKGMTYNPTETCVAPNGDIYIADGYGASFIHCFTNKGEYQFSFGGAESSPSEESLINPHGVAIDYRPLSRGEAPLLVISSRKQSSFKFFSLNGEFVHSIILPGAYPCRPVIKNELLYCGVCWSGPVVSEQDLDNYAKRFDNSGFVLVINEKGRIQHAIGAKAPTYIDGKLQPLQADGNHSFYHIHDVLPLNKKNILISQWRGNNALPYLITL